MAKSRKYLPVLCRRCTLSGMDPRHVDLLRSIDPAVLGARIKTARIAAGLTQKGLGASDATVSYVSRIESGARRPEPRVISRIAGRLGTSVEELLVGLSARDAEAVLVAVDFAELSLELGDVKEAAARLDELLQDDLVKATPEYGRARLLRARAFEATGDLDGAILALESLVGDDPGGQTVEAGIALSRCYREAGDLTRAIQIGEKILAGLADNGLTVGDEIVQLTVTVAAAYFERGDTGYAVRLCRHATEAADRFGSPRAKAAAYWNASAMEERRGHIDAAVPLAKRALALLGEGQDIRNLGRLRTQLGIMQLQLDPPDTVQAEHNLEFAARELSLTGTNNVDVLRNKAARAQARFLAGDPLEAENLLSELLTAGASQSPHITADAHALQGQIAAARGDVASARSYFLRAVQVLSGIGADRGAGQLWLDLAALLESVGELDIARDAYRSAAVATGLTVRAIAATPVRLAQR